MISDAVNGNWSIARDTVKDTVSIGLAHAEGALMPAVEPIIEQTKARESYSRRCHSNIACWMRSLGLPPDILYGMRICSPLSIQAGIDAANAQLQKYSAIADAKYGGETLAVQLPCSVFSPSFTSGLNRCAASLRRGEGARGGVAQHERGSWGWGCTRGDPGCACGAPMPLILVTGPC